MPLLLSFTEKQGGQIGISRIGEHVEPYSESTEDRAAVKRNLDFELGWYTEPLVYGDYPKSMRHLVKERLPIFTKEERRLLKYSFDFVGINYYTSRYGKNNPASLMKPICYRNDPLAPKKPQDMSIPYDSGFTTSITKTISIAFPKSLLSGSLKS